MKKTLAVLAALCVCLSAALNGCSGERRIDSAALVKAITVRELNGSLDYTFYMFDDEDGGVTIETDSLSSAVASAENGCIPSLSLAKLELVLFGGASDVLVRDLKYMAQSGKTSPLVTVAEADEAAVDIFADDKNAAESVEKRIMLLKNNYDGVSTTALEIFNNLFGKSKNELSIAYVSANKELKAEKTKFSLEK